MRHMAIGVPVSYDLSEGNNLGKPANAQSDRKLYANRVSINTY